jgi:hypothetical protein
MKRSGLLFLGLLVTSFLFAQKQINDRNAQVRNVKGFHAIRVSTGIQLYLTQGSAEAVAVSASEEEYRDRIKTEVDNGVLKIYYDYNLLKELGDRSRKHLKAYVSFINLDGIDGSSGSSVQVEGVIKVSKLDMDFSSGAEFTGNIDVSKMKAEQSSGAVVKIAGKADNIEIDGSSGSVFHGYDLVVDQCDAESSSGSSIQVTVNKELSAQASSGGSIGYKGTGVIRNIHTGSGGSVSKKG